MKLPCKLLTTIFFGISLALTTFKPNPALADALDQKEIRELARNISVKIVESNSSGNGSGVIFNRKKNIYSVLTNQHVAGHSGNYEIHTPDGQKHSIASKEEIPGLDLMVVQFESKNEYQIAPLGDSEGIAPLQLVYVAGFPAIQADLDIVDGKIRSVRQNVLKNPQENQGYALVYTNQTLPGSSGGAVLDESGNLIGINGEAERDFRSGRDISRGIPINLFISLSFNYLPEDEFEQEEIPPEEQEEEQEQVEVEQEVVEEEGNEDDEDDEDNEDIAYIPQVVGNSNYSLAFNIAKEGGEIKSVSITPNGQTIVTAGEDNKIRVWNGLTGKLERTLSQEDEAIANVAISADGNTIVSSGDGGKISIWNRRTGVLERNLEDEEDRINSIALSLNGNIIISGGGDQKVRVWNRQTGSLERVLEGHEAEIKSVAVSADGNIIVSGGQDRQLKVWDWRNWQLKQTLEGHKEEVRAVAISADGRTVASGSGDRTIKVWDTSGQLRHTLKGHEGKVDSIVISSDGNTIVSGSRDRTIKIWNTVSATLEQSLTTDRADGINSIAASANEQVVVSGNEDSSLAIWYLK